MIQRKFVVKGINRKTETAREKKVKRERRKKTREEKK
jgi:hypothetical protein